ncbi:MAG TPA: regulatory protein RecX [Candidatus Limnocylindrales bacterium]|nr:regulatory protein RecX [Candidatus Limnocylindrales bacterium]
MTDGTGIRRARRESLAERRERRGAVDDPAAVLDAAARFLEARSRSVAEVRRRLTGAGYRAELVDGAIARLLEIGILDDEVFARLWVESRDRAHPRGEAALRRELRLKGVEPAVIDAVLAERDSPSDGGERDEATDDGEGGDPTDGDDRRELGRGSATADSTAADRLLARSARTLARVADARVRRQRAYALLARHGFDPDTASDAVRRFLTESDPA